MRYAPDLVAVSLQPVGGTRTLVSAVAAISMLHGGLLLRQRRSPRYRACASCPVGKGTPAHDDRQFTHPVGHSAVAATLHGRGPERRGPPRPPHAAGRR